MRKLIIITMVANIFSIPNTSKADREPFWAYWIQHWWVETGNGCGAGPGEMPNWLFTTSNDVATWSGTAGIADFHHNYTLPDVGVDTWQIRVESEACPKSGTIKDYHNWFHRAYNGSEWFWDTSVDFEVYKGWYRSYGNDSICIYVGEEKDEICNRNFQNIGLYTRYARFWLVGYDFSASTWREKNAVFWAPPAIN